MNADILTNILLLVLSGIGGAALSMLSSLNKKTGNIEINTAMLNERTEQHEKTLNRHESEISQFKKLSA